MTTGVDFRSPSSNRRASSLLGATASPGMSAVYSAHYSAKKNPLNPKQRPVRISARRTLAKSLDIADARSPSKLSDPEINAAPADDLAERPLKESVSDSGDGRESIISEFEDDHDDHNGDDRQDDHNDRGRRRTNVSPPQPFKGKGKDPSIDWRRGASLLDDDEEKPRAPLKTLIGSNETIIKLMGNLIRNDNKWDGEDGSYRTFSIRWMNALKTISPFLVHIVTGEVSYPDAYDNMGGPPNEEMDHQRMEFCRLSSLLASLLANSCPSEAMS
jgi:hypothetical protein